MVRVTAFIEPCLPSRAERPPSGPGWVHEIKHDGFRLWCAATARESGWLRAMGMTGRGASRWLREAEKDWERAHWRWRRTAPQDP